MGEGPTGASILKKSADNARGSADAAISELKNVERVLERGAKTSGDTGDGVMGRLAARLSQATQQALKLQASAQLGQQHGGPSLGLGGASKAEEVDE